jgi:hypothetical protein
MSKKKRGKKGATLDDVMWDEASCVAEQEMHK